MAAARTCVIALDVGGTVVKGGLVTPDNTFAYTGRRATERARGPAAIGATVADFAELRCKARYLGLTPRAVGVVVPGVVDAVDRRVWRDAVSVLADGILAAQLLFDADLVVIGGGVSRAGETLLVPLRAMLTDRATVQHVPRVVSAALGDTAGCHGAALLAWDALDAAVAA